MIQISPAIAVTLLLAFLGMVASFGKILMGQFEKRMTEKLHLQDELRQEQITTLEDKIVDAATQTRELLDKFDAINTTLPLKYVQREDWIRFSSTIDSKLDRLAELVLRGSKGGASS